MAESGYARLRQELDNLVKIPARESKEIEDIFFPMKQKKGGRFVSEGEVPGCIAFVAKGLYKYYYIDRDGTERIKHFSAENDFIASYACFIMQKPSMYYIEAMEDSELLVLRYGDFRRGIENSIFWSAIGRIYAERMYIIKELREGSFLKDTAEARYGLFVRDYQHIAKRIRQKDIASYLGITPETLSRIKHRKIRDGIDLGTELI